MDGEGGRPASVNRAGALGSDRGIRRGPRAALFALLVPAVLLLLGAYVVPLGHIVALSIRGAAGPFAQYVRIFQDPVLIAVLLRTVRLALQVTLLCLVLGYPVAYLMLRSTARMRRMLGLLVILPVWISILVRSYAWMVILGRRGLVNEALQALGLVEEPMSLLYNRFSVYVGMVHIMLPFMILPLYAIMQRIDLRLMAAARTLGAGTVPAFLLVFLPLSLPGVLSGSLLVFIISLGFFVTPALLGGLEDITYVMLIERQVNHLHNWELAAAMAVVLLLATLVLVAVFQRIVAIRSTAAGAAAQTSAWLTPGVTIGLALLAQLRGLVFRRRGHAPDLGGAGDHAARVPGAVVDRMAAPVFSARVASRAPEAGWWARVSLPTCVAWLVVAFLCFPIVILFPLAFSDALFLQFPPPGLSLRWFAKYFSRDDWVRPTITSFLVAALTMVGATVVGTLAAIPLVRGGYRWRGAITAFLLSPLIVPSIILAISVYFFFARLGLVGTIRGLVLAHLVLAVPYVVVVVSAALQTADEGLELAACTLGATRSGAFLRITLPLILPGILAGALFAFLASFDELVVALFISGTTAKTLPKRMWDGIREEIDPTIAAVATLLILLSIAFVVAVEVARTRARALRREPETRQEIA